MAQSDFFSKMGNVVSGLNDKIVNITNSMEHFSEIERELADAISKNVINENKAFDIKKSILEQELNISRTRKDLLTMDKNEHNILKKIVGVHKKVYQQISNVKDIEKELNTALKEQNKLEKKAVKLEEEILDLKEKSKKLTGKDKKANKEAINDAETRAKFTRKQADLMRLNNAETKAGLAQVKKSIPILGQMGKVGDALMPIVNEIGSIGKVVGGIIGGVINIGTTIFKFLLSPIKKAFDFFLKIQSVSGNLSANIGLTNDQSRGLLNNFTKLTISAMKFGGTIEDVATIMEQFSNITGKNRLFSSEDMSSLVELGLGTGLGVQGASELAASFDNIGVSLEKTINLTDKARTTSAKMNINTTKVLTTYNELVKSLTGIGYGKGLENLEKLAAKAIAIRFDIVNSTKSFTDSFFNPEQAVETSAKMQVLGGKFAAGFGDPMQLAFESMTDPTVLANKFANTLKGMVTKGKDGLFTIPPAQRKILQLAAEALGQNYEDAKNSAIEQAKVADKMASLSKSGFSLLNFSEEDKLAVANLMKIGTNGKYEIMMSDGTTKLLENITDKNQLKQIIASRKSNENAAMGRKNLVERLQMIIDRVLLGFSTVFSKLFGGNTFENFLTAVEKTSSELAGFISKYITDNGGLASIFDSIIKKGKGIFDQIAKIWDPKSNGDILTRLGETFKTVLKPLAMDILKGIIPLFKAAIAFLFDAIGDTLPSYLGGNAFKASASNLNADVYNSGGLAAEILGKPTKTDKNNIANKNNRSLGDTSLLLGKQLLGFSKSPLLSNKIGSGFKDLRAGGGIKGIGKNATDLFTKTTQSGSKVLPNGQVINKVGKNITGKLGSDAIKNNAKFASKLIGKKALSRIPILGTLASGYFAYNDFAEGDTIGGLLNIASGLANLANIIAPGIGSSLSMGIDGVNMGREMGAFDDGVIYKDGSYAKFGKGDMIQMVDQNSAEHSVIDSKKYGKNGLDELINNNSSYSHNVSQNDSNSNVVHSGTIRIESNDGKVVTWEQMYSARDLIGSRMASIQQGYNKGFGDYQNPNTAPIKPLTR